MWNAFLCHHIQELYILKMVLYFGPPYRMSDSRKIRLLLFGILDENKI